MSNVWHTGRSAVYRELRLSLCLFGLDYLKSLYKTLSIPLVVPPWSFEKQNFDPFPLCHFSDLSYYLCCIRQFTFRVKQGSSMIVRERVVT